MNLNDDIKVLPMADDEEDLTDSNRPSLDNEHVIDFETNTVSIRKQKRDIQRTSSHEYVFDPNSGSYKIKEKKSCYDTLRAHLWTKTEKNEQNDNALKKPWRYPKIIMFALFVAVLVMCQNEIMTSVNERKLLTCVRGVFRTIDVFKWFSYTDQQMRLEHQFGKAFMEYFQENKRSGSWDDWYFLDEVMVNKGIQLQSLPESVRQNPSEFLKFAAVFRATSEAIRQSNIGIKQAIIGIKIYIDFVERFSMSFVHLLLSVLGQNYRQLWQCMKECKDFSGLSEVKKVIDNQILGHYEPEINADFISSQFPDLSLNAEGSFRLAVKYGAFFTKYPDSSLFGNRNDPETFTKFKKILDGLTHQDTDYFIELITNFYAVSAQFSNAGWLDLFEGPLLPQFDTFFRHYHSFYEKLKRIAQSHPGDFDFNAKKSRLFGDRNDPQSLINFKIFLDAQIVVIDLDECFYYARSGKYMSSPEDNLEFDILIEIGLFTGKEVYFYTSATQTTVEANADGIWARFKAKIECIKIAVKSDKQRQWNYAKELRFIVDELDKGKKILVMDNSAFEWREDFDLEHFSALCAYGGKAIDIMANNWFESEKAVLFDAKRDSKYPKAHFLVVAPFDSKKALKERDRLFTTTWEKRLQNAWAGLKGRDEAVQKKYGNRDINWQEPHIQRSRA